MVRGEYRYVLYSDKMVEIAHTNGSLGDAKKLAASFFMGGKSKSPVIWIWKEYPRHELLGTVEIEPDGICYTSHRTYKSEVIVSRKKRRV